MIEFETRVRGMVRSAVMANMSEFGRVRGNVLLALASRSLTGRLDASALSRSLMLARAPAWARIQTNLMHQLGLVHAATLDALSTSLGTSVTGDLFTYIERPFLDTTVPKYLKAAETLEVTRAYNALRQAYGRKQKPMDAFEEQSPYTQSNSAVSALTVTAATAIINFTTLDAMREAGKDEYILWTSGEQRDHTAYSGKHKIGKGPIGPMFLGDRTIMVPA